MRAICFFGSFNFVQEYLVPEEYVQTMRESMLNKCPVSTYEQVCEVVEKELGDKPDKVCNCCYIEISHKYKHAVRTWASSIIHFLKLHLMCRF